MRSYPQQGVMSTYQLGAHTHRTATQGGIILENSLDLGCISRVYRNADQVIPSGVVTKILYNAEDYDVGDNFDADGVDSLFLVPMTAYYFLYGQAVWANLGDEKSGDIYIFNNGGRLVKSEYICAGAAEQLSAITLTHEHLTLGDEITFHVEHNAGANRNIKANRDETFAIIHQLGV